MIQYDVFGTDNASNCIDVYPSFLLDDWRDLRTVVDNKLAP